MKSLKGIRLNVIEDGLNKKELDEITGGREHCRTFGACVMQKCSGYRDCDWMMDKFTCFCWGISKFL